MLVIVAFPVQLIDVAPGPKYSMIELVPPDTESFPATYKITSFGAVQPFIFPFRKTPILFG